jgi:putative oxidoreductase
MSRRCRTAEFLDVALWVVQIAAAAKFFLVGCSNLAGQPDPLAAFEETGFVRYATGTLEVAGAYALLFPRPAALGAIVLALVTARGMVVRLFSTGEIAILPVMLVTSMALVAWARFERSGFHMHNPQTVIEPTVPKA